MKAIWEMSDSMSEVPRRRRIALLAVAVVLGLSGCTGLRLHDASKAAVADSAKQQFTDAKVTETVDAALENSKKFLDEAERIAGLEAEVRKKRAQLDIAESPRSMATWLRARWAEQGALGFKDTATAHLRLQARVRIEGAEKTARKNRSRFRTFAKDPEAAKLLGGPLCAGIAADSPVPKVSKLKKKQPKRFRSTFKIYKTACVKLAAAKKALPKKVMLDSALDRGEKARLQAQDRRDSFVAAAEAAKQELAQAREELKTEQAKWKTGKSGIAELRAKAKKARDAADKVLTLAENAGLETEPLDNIKHLAVLLGAISSGQVDKDAVAKNTPLAKASLAAAELPSLAEDAIALITAGKAPPVNHLILELNHQQILYDRARELSNLWDEELAMHDQKVAALEEQAKQYREVQYRLCNYATMKAGKKHQGEACAVMSFEDKDKTCKIGPAPVLPTPAQPATAQPVSTQPAPAQPAPAQPAAAQPAAAQPAAAQPAPASLQIDDCVLAKSWRENYKNDKTSNAPRAKRQFLAALLAHARALDARASVRKIEFQMINVGHKRIAVSNRAAVAAWNNLVAVPVDTLAAYHKSGIKPDTVANAAAQLLGLLGVGVGIAVSD